MRTRTAFLQLEVVCPATMTDTKLIKLLRSIIDVGQADATSTAELEDHDGCNNSTTAAYLASQLVVKTPRSTKN